MPATLAAIHARCSVGPRHLVGPAPDAAALRAVAAAASAAPDHGGLGPFRLIHIPDTARGQLAQIFAAAAREADPAADDATLDRARARALSGPGLLAVVVDLHDHPQVPHEEQWVSAGAALQNTLLAFEDLGFRAKMLSGARVRATALRAAFGLGPGSHLLGFIAVGRLAGALRQARRRAPEQVLSDSVPT